MFSISKEELKKLPKLGKTVKCPKCNKLHKVRQLTGDAGVNKVESSLAFVKCGDTDILVGMQGKCIVHKK